MNFLRILAVNKGDTMDVGTGALYALVAILMVFAILLIIIGITALVFKLTGLFEMKAELDKAKKSENEPKIVTSNRNSVVEIKDDDMMAAVLVATIDYRNEIKKDVRVVSVNEIK